MKNYRIEYRADGKVFKPVYTTTIAGAVQVARKKGWYDFSNRGPESNWDFRPTSAKIFERVERDFAVVTWELIATITEKGIEAEDCQSRSSFKKADRIMASARSHVESTNATMMALNAIANKEYAKAK